MKRGEIIDQFRPLEFCVSHTCFIAKDKMHKHEGEFYLFLISELNDTEIYLQNEEEKNNKQIPWNAEMWEEIDTLDERCLLHN